MKLLRFGAAGREKPGMLDAQGRLRDLSGVIADITAAEVTRSGMQRLQAVDPKSLPLVDGAPRCGVPIAGIGKFIGVGLNYVDHASESNLPIPPEPIFFTKAISCLNGPNDPVMLPRGAMKLDWEVELGVVIGTTCRYVAEDAALSHVAGFVLVNDVSERAFQLERGSQWDKGKGCDTFGPVGPWLVTPDEVGDCQALDMFLDVNGVRMQTGNTSTMIFRVRQCLAYISSFMTLFPGDLLTTGTPPGVGAGKKPNPIFLKDGDVMHLGITRLGEQRQRVLAFSPTGMTS